METQILGNNNIGNGTQIINNTAGGTQVINNVQSGGTQVINQNPVNGGTRVINQNPVNGGTQVIGDNISNISRTFTGGLLTKEDVILGWRILEKIPVSSGEADLYIAEKNGEKGVIKYYRGNIHPKEELLKQLLQLKHPDIINIYEYGNYKGHFFEIMEYAKGGSLDSRNPDGSYKYLPLSEENVIQVCKEVINSYKTCHEKGIIHRDIKPANLYFRNEDGTDVVIGDFGISSVYGEEESVSHRTQTASRTTGYAAPEVLSGIITPKMDYYALGITLWEIATGKDPFVLESGKRRNDAHLIRDTIEGRIVNDLLSKEPVLSEKLQYLIRGLLVIDDKKRWGYDEVTRYLNGEKVEIVSVEKKTCEYSVGEKHCSTLEEIGNAIAANLEGAKKDIYKGFLAGALESAYPDISKKIDVITEEASAKNEYNLGLLRIVWLLNPSYPFKTKNGFEAENLEDMIHLILNAPEEMIPLIKDHQSIFYPYIEHLGYMDKIAEIKEITKGIKDKEDFALMLCVCQIAVILKDKTIKPFKLDRYKDFELSELQQIMKIPHDLRNLVLMIISERSCEGLFLPWLLLQKPDLNFNMITDWESFMAQI